MRLGTVVLPEKFAKERPEQLSVAQFVELTLCVQEQLEI